MRKMHFLNTSTDAVSDRNPSGKKKIQTEVRVAKSAVTQQRLLHMDSYGLWCSLTDALSEGLLLCFMQLVRFHYPAFVSAGDVDTFEKHLPEAMRNYI